MSLMEVFPDLIYPEAQGENRVARPERPNV